MSPYDLPDSEFCTDTTVNFNAQTIRDNLDGPDSLSLRDHALQFIGFRLLDEVTPTVRIDVFNYRAAGRRTLSPVTSGSIYTLVLVY